MTRDWKTDEKRERESRVESRGYEYGNGEGEQEFTLPSAKV